jgi:aspartate aminotransferase/aminotransferase
MHGPAAIIDKLTMLQQYTFVCAPHPLQWAALAALDIDMSEYVAAYRRRRDLVVSGLTEAGYRVANPGGAFYAFPQVPDGRGTASEFVGRAIAEELLIIPGGIFSSRDTHFRISYAASEETIQRGLAVLAKLNSR